MRVGSLVELVDDTNWSYKPGVIYPVKNKIYTIRDFSDTYSIKPSLRLVEIVNTKRHHKTGFTEPSFKIERFRELQPPIANIEEHINKNTLEPELI